MATYLDRFGNFASNVKKVNKLNNNVVKLLSEAIGDPESTLETKNFARRLQEAFRIKRISASEFFGVTSKILEDMTKNHELTDTRGTGTSPMTKLVEEIKCHLEKKDGFENDLRSALEGLYPVE